MTVLAVLCLVAGVHCALLAVRGAGRARLADANHAVMAGVMAAMAVPTLVGAPRGVAWAVGLGALATAWAVVAVRSWRGAGTRGVPGCGLHPLHLVVAHAAMVVMVLGHGSHAAHGTPGAVPATGMEGMPGMAGHGATATGGPSGPLLVVGLVLGVYFAVHAARALAGVATDRRAWSQAAMSGAMAAMLLVG